MKGMAISFMLCIHECAFQAMSTTKCLQCYKINLILLNSSLGSDRVMQSTDQHTVKKNFILNSTDLAPIY